MYFDVVDGLAVVYGKGLVLPFVALAAALFAVAVAVAVRRKLLTVRGLSVALLATAAVLGVALLVMAVAWGMYRTAYEQRTWSEAGVVISDFYRLGLVLLAAAVIVAAYELLLRRLRPWDLAVAALLWWLAGRGGRRGRRARGQLPAHLAAGRGQPGAARRGPPRRPRPAQRGRRGASLWRAPPPASSS